MNKISKRNIIAGLLCLTIFPGAGQYYLGLKKLGISIISVSFLMLVLIMQRIVVIAEHIAEKIVNGEIAGDINELQIVIQQQLAQGSNTLISLASTLLLLCWLGSAAHAIFYQEVG